MSAAHKVALILGAGPNIGQHTGQAFATKGYKIALVTRNAPATENTDQKIHIQGDVSNPTSVADIFQKVRSSLGIPNVVVYNAAAATFDNKTNPLSLSLDAFTKDLNINTISAFAAAQQAVLGFEELPKDVPKAFLYTGNILNERTMPPLMSLGVGKSATAHIIEYAANAYKDRGFRFYYCDERTADGSSAGAKVDGKAHAELYIQLAEDKSQGPWQQTFVKNSGYKKF